MTWVLTQSRISSGKDGWKSISGMRNAMNKAMEVGKSNKTREQGPREGLGRV